MYELFHCNEMLKSKTNQDVFPVHALESNLCTQAISTHSVWYLLCAGYCGHGDHDCGSPTILQISHHQLKAVVEREKLYYFDIVYFSTEMLFLTNKLQPKPRLTNWQNLIENHQISRRFSDQGYNQGWLFWIDGDYVPWTRTYGGVIRLNLGLI